MSVPCVCERRRGDPAGRGQLVAGRGSETCARPRRRRSGRPDAPGSPCRSRRRPCRRRRSGSAPGRTTVSVIRVSCPVRWVKGAVGCAPTTSASAQVPSSYPRLGPAVDARACRPAARSGTPSPLRRCRPATNGVPRRDLPAPVGGHDLAGAVGVARCTSLRSRPRLARRAALAAAVPVVADADRERLAGVHQVGDVRGLVVALARVAERGAAIRPTAVQEQLVGVVRGGVRAGPDHPTVGHRHLGRGRACSRPPRWWRAGSRRRPPSRRRRCRSRSGRRPTRATPGPCGPRCGPAT